MTNATVTAIAAVIYVMTGQVYEMNGFYYEVTFCGRMTRMPGNDGYAVRVDQIDPNDLSSKTYRYSIKTNNLKRVKGGLSRKKVMQGIENDRLLGAIGNGTARLIEGATIK